ncbi:hypothetical protein H1C71_008138, partial [Ictidomys tridecemlineatus]
MPPEGEEGGTRAHCPASLFSSQGSSFFFPVTRERAHGWGICNSLISTRHRTSFNTRGFAGDSARMRRFKAMDRASIPIVKHFPIETFGTLLPLGFWVVGFSGGEVGLAVECSPSFLPSGLGWDFAGLETSGTHKTKPSQEGLSSSPFLPLQTVARKSDLVQRKQLSSGACTQPHFVICLGGQSLGPQALGVLEAAYH